MSLSKLSLALLALVGANQAFANTDVAKQQCLSLNQVQLYQTQLQAQWAEAGDIPADPNSAFTGTTVRDVPMSAHCVVNGEIERRIGADGKPYAIKFQLRLPEQWNGKFLFQGGGGANGFIAPALGSIPSSNSTATPALLRGYAVASMDSGHQGKAGEAVFDVSFANEQLARINYAYAAIGKVTERAKQLIAYNYQTEPKYSYYMGCSTGGREAMIAAQRYPQEFDGVVVGNAAFRLSRATLGATWNYQHLMSIAPTNAQGQKILAKSLTKADLNLLNQAVLKQCDSKDGLADGIINAWEQCDFDPNTLTEQLGNQKVAVIKALFEGAKNSQGEAVYTGFPYHASLATDAWREWWIGLDEQTPVNTLNNILTIPLLMHYFMQPNGQDPLAFDFDKDIARTLNTRGLNDGDSPNLTSFKANGGKMIIFEGSADPIFSAFDQRDWYQQMDQVTGEAERFARLFTVPGMTHCSGGNALDDFDPLTALENWREQGQAPNYLLAKGKAFPNKQMPICAYPKIATYIGGDENQASSFECR